MMDQLPTLKDLPPETKPIADEISIVIPTLGRPLLETCLYYIVAGTVWPAGIYVVDQGRKSEVGDWMATVRGLGIDAQHIESDQRGRSAGINRGLERVTTRFVAITDDDCFVDARWLEQLLLRLHEVPDRIVTGRVEPAGDDDFCTVTSLEPRLYTRPELKAQPLIGGNMAVSMALVQRIGPFDEHPSIHAAEDSDWGYRALRAGVAITYDPSVIVSHYSWRDISQRAQRYYQYSRSQGGFYGKHLLKGDTLIVQQAGRALLRGPLRWLRGILRRDQDMIDRGRAATLMLLPGIIAGLRR